jgi:hypothetical protein
MFNEFETTKLLEENLSKLDGIKIHKPLETGLVAEYKVNDGPYLLFRADIDALPIKEETGAEFASKNDCMHACGHDVHTSILYGFTEYVTKSKIDKNILFLFQPGEEAGGGAEKVIDSGILDKFNITNAFALHVTDEYDKPVVIEEMDVDLDFLMDGEPDDVDYEHRKEDLMLSTLTAIYPDKIHIHCTEYISEEILNMMGIIFGIQNIIFHD